MIRILRSFFEKRVFGVSAWWADKLGINASYIRLLFIYSAFTNVMTVIIYLSMVCILKLRNHFKYKKKKSVFDL
jgi:phage shock protein PspC (stress-responsive transcriptional regulator)